MRTGPSVLLMLAQMAKLYLFGAVPLPAAAEIAMWDGDQQEISTHARQALDRHWQQVRQLNGQWQDARRQAAAIVPREALPLLDFADPEDTRWREFRHVHHSFRRLCNYTDYTLRSLLTYDIPDRVYDPRRHVLDAWPADVLAGRSEVNTARAFARVELRPGAPVRVIPWGAYGNKNYDDMMDWLEECRMGPDPSFVRWSAYLHDYAEARLTGRVVEILPEFVPAGPMGQPPSRRMSPRYVVRFPLPALPWSVENRSFTGGPHPAHFAPFAPEEDEDVPMLAMGEGDAIPVPPGGWRLSRTGATRALNQGRRAGSSDHGQGAYMELEVPYYRLYVDVAAAEAQGMNPFRADIMVGNLHQRGLGDEEAEEELRAYDHGCG